MVDRVHSRAYGVRLGFGAGLPFRGCQPSGSTAEALAFHNWPHRYKLRAMRKPTSAFWFPLVFLAVAAALVALAGCSESSTQSKQERRDARIQKAKAELAKGPEVRTYNIGADQLLVMETPVSDIYGFVDYQRCFVWRDSEFKIATISCAQKIELSLEN